MTTVPSSSDFLPAEITNTYYGFRHGESQANTAHIIASHIESGRPYGLTDTGKAQVLSSCQTLSFKTPPLIFASDFTRTIETAQIISDHFGSVVTLSELLRERYFGEFDLNDDSNYPLVWELDRNDPAHRQFQVESVLDVTVRLSALICELESRYRHESIILVTHGDIVALLSALFGRVDVCLFRDFGVKTGSVTLLNP